MKAEQSEIIKKRREILARYYNSGTTDRKELKELIEEEIGEELTMVKITNDITTLRKAGKIYDKYFMLDLKRLYNEEVASVEEIAKKLHMERNDVEKCIETLDKKGELLKEEERKAKKEEDLEYLKIMEKPIEEIQKEDIQLLCNRFEKQPEIIEKFDAYILNCKDRMKKNTFPKEKIEVIKNLVTLVEKTEYIMFLLELYHKYGEFFQGLEFADSQLQKKDKFTEEERQKINKEKEFYKRAIKAKAVLIKGGSVVAASLASNLPVKYVEQLLYQMKCGLKKEGTEQIEENEKEEIKPNTEEEMQKLIDQFSLQPEENSSILGKFDNYVLACRIRVNEKTFRREELEILEKIANLTRKSEHIIFVLELYTRYGMFEQGIQFAEKAMTGKHFSKEEKQIMCQIKEQCERAKEAIEILEKEEGVKKAVEETRITRRLCEKAR